MDGSLLLTSSLWDGVLLCMSLTRPLVHAIIITHVNVSLCLVFNLLHGLLPLPSSICSLLSHTSALALLCALCACLLLLLPSLLHRSSVVPAVCFSMLLSCCQPSLFPSCLFTPSLSLCTLCVISCCLSPFPCSLQGFCDV